MIGIDSLLNKIPGIRMQNMGKININFKNIVRSESTIDESADLNDPLGIDYQPWGEDFVILLSNRTSTDIRHVFLHIVLSTLDDRHRWYARRPLYRTEAQSKQSGLTDYLDSDEREIGFHVNTAETVAHHNRGDRREDHAGNFIIDWSQKRQGNRDSLYMMPYIGYEFLDGKEKKQRIDRFVEIPMRGVTGRPENGVYTKLEKAIGRNGLSQNEYEAITGPRGPLYLNSDRYFS